MTNKYKLRDLTAEQYYKWRSKNCKGFKITCDKCPFKNVLCNNGDMTWVNNKDIYSNMFLDQEIEIDEDILDKKEKEYLEAVLRPFKKRVRYIKKSFNFFDDASDFIIVVLESIFGLYPKEYITLPYFKKNTMYKGMVYDKEYSIKELGLFEKDV